MINIQREISRTIPNNVPPRFFVGGTPILTAYGCALLERDTGKSFVYTAVNLKSGKTEMLSRRVNPLSPTGVEAMVNKIRQAWSRSSVLLRLCRIISINKFLDDYSVYTKECSDPSIIIIKIFYAFITP